MSKECLPDPKFISEKIEELYNKLVELGAFDIDIKCNLIVDQLKVSLKESYLTNIEEIKNLLSSFTEYFPVINLHYNLVGGAGELYESYESRETFLSGNSPKIDKGSISLAYGEPIEEKHYVVCPTTGKKLHPTTLLPIESSVDFTNMKIL